MPKSPPSHAGRALLPAASQDPIGIRTSPTPAHSFPAPMLKQPGSRTRAQHLLQPDNNNDDDHRPDEEQRMESRIVLSDDSPICFEAEVNNMGRAVNLMFFAADELWFVWAGLSQAKVRVLATPRALLARWS